MADYIEREALMRRIKEIHCAECDSYHGVRCRACWVDDTLDYVDCEPAADVVEVRHGEWLVEYDKYWKKWRIICPYCKNEYTSITKHLKNYCSHCGAKMDGERKENNEIDRC